MKRLVGLCLALLFSLAACDDFAAPTDFDSGPSGGGGSLSLQKVSGDNQTGSPGEQLADPYVVKVVDGAGGAVPGVTVNFAIQQGDGGSLTSSAVVTDSSGNAGIKATLPQQVGVEQTVVASSSDAVNTVGFTSTTLATTAGAANLRIISGDGQKGIVRDTLLDPLVVEVTDGDGVAVPGVSVKWQVVGGDGSVRQSPSVTNQQGLATNRWRVGNVAGAIEEVIAWIEPQNAVPDTVSFTANLTGVPDTIVIEQGALELDNNATKAPETVIGDSVFVAPGHWADKAFKGVLLDADGRTVRGATLTWTVTDDFDQVVGFVGDEPEGGGSEAVMVNTASDGGITVWRKAPACDPAECVGTWIGATLSLEKYPDVTPITLDALIRN